VKVVNVMLTLDAVSVIPIKCTVSQMAASLCETLRRQVLAAETCIRKYSKV